MAYAEVYIKNGGKGVVSAVTLPTGNGTYTNFKAINANMAVAGALLVEIGGTKYALPLLLNA